MTQERIEISAKDGGTFNAYLSTPDSGAGPGILMLHEIFGLTDWVTETADIFAAQCYCVLAPDMFWRLEPNFVGDHNDTEQREKGLRYRGMIDHDLAVDDMDAAIATLKSMDACNGKIGVTGFCTGGTLTYLAAARLNIDAASVYYGTQIHEFLDEAGKISCPTILHMGDRDDHVPAPLAKEITDAVSGNSSVTCYSYAAGHAFANTHRPEYLVQDACDASHARTHELFGQLK